MSRAISTVPSFERAAKKLAKAEKDALDKAVRAIAENPSVGEGKKGDLTGLSVCKFKVNRQLRLLGYTYDDDEVVLIAYGPHENFYRDLKRSQ